MISIAVTAILLLMIIAIFIYALIALLKKNIYIKSLKISKKEGFQLEFHAKEKNEAKPTKDPRS